MSDTPVPPRLRTADVVRAALVVAAVAALALLLWRLAEVLLLGFAAVLVALLLRTVAVQFERHTRLGPAGSLAVSTVLAALLIGAFFALLGTQIQSQVSTLVERFPQLIEATGQRLGIENLQQRLMQKAERITQSSGLLGTIAGYTSAAVAALANLVLVLVGGLYLAARPRVYRDGLLQLFPDGARQRLGRAFDGIGRALQLWLLGQLISMAVVGVLVTVGLYAIGMPSALALGFLAGVSEFVPLVGPALAAIPAILVALSEDGNTLLWVLGLYLAVQQLENNVIMPLVQRRTVDLPPVLALFAILALGILFGPLGVLLGTPLTVAVFVAVKQLYVRDVLGERTPLPGEHPQRGRKRR